MQQRVAMKTTFTIKADIGDSGSIADRVRPSHVGTAILPTPSWNTPASQGTSKRRKAAFGSA
jgi:hypothetical protein